MARTILGLSEERRLLLTCLMWIFELEDSGDLGAMTCLQDVRHRVERYTDEVRSGLPFASALDQLRTRVP